MHGIPPSNPNSLFLLTFQMVNVENVRNTRAHSASWTEKTAKHHTITVSVRRDLSGIRIKSASPRS